MTTPRYSSIASALHWAIAVLIVLQLAGGIYMHKLPDTTFKFDLYQLHKSFGVTILALTFVRIFWRLGHKPPPLPDGMAGWERKASNLTHFAFYALLIAIPLAGWAFVSAAPLRVPTVLFDVAVLPHLPFFDGIADREPIADVFAEIHEYLAFGLIGLLVLHVGAAMKHHFVERDDVFTRMAPAGPGGFLFPGAALGVILLTGAFSFVSTGEAPPVVARSHGDEAAIPGAWKIDYEKSRLGFAAVQAGREFSGTFSDWRANIVFDPENLEDARIEVTVNPGSARTGDRQRDTALPERDWFAISDFPEAQFISSQVARAAEGGYAARGDLTIRGVTKNIVLPFLLEIDGDQAHAVGKVSLIRTDFGIGQGEFETEEWVDFEVDALFEITASRSD